MKNVLFMVNLARHVFIFYLYIYIYPKYRLLMALPFLSLIGVGVSTAYHNWINIIGLLTDRIIGGGSGWGWGWGWIVTVLVD